jgi:hypothetical protein
MVVSQEFAVMIGAKKELRLSRKVKHCREAIFFAMGDN